MLKEVVLYISHPLRRVRMLTTSTYLPVIQLAVNENVTWPA